MSMPDPSRPQKVAIVTLGCGRNEVDSQNAAGMLTTAGYQVVDDPEQADAIVVNTCAFIDAAKAESIVPFRDYVRLPQLLGAPPLRAWSRLLERLYRWCRQDRGWGLRRGGGRKSTRLNSSHPSISYAVFCLKKKNTKYTLHLLMPKKIKQK